MSSNFVYVTYIRTTPEKVWEAITNPDFNRKFWFGMHQESERKKGAEWKLVFSDGRVTDVGAVLESEPPKRLVLRWHNEFRPELKAEGDTRCSFVIEQEGEVVRLTVRHE